MERLHQLLMGVTKGSSDSQQPAIANDLNIINTTWANGRAVEYLLVWPKVSLDRHTEELDNGALHALCVAWVQYSYRWNTSLMDHDKDDINQHSLIVLRGECEW